MPRAAKPKTITNKTFEHEVSELLASIFAPPAPVAPKKVKKKPQWCLMHIPTGKFLPDRLFGSDNNEAEEQDTNFESLIDNLSEYKNASRFNSKNGLYNLIIQSVFILEKISSKEFLSLPKELGLPKPDNTEIYRSISFNNLSGSNNRKKYNINSLTNFFIEDPKTFAPLLNESLEITHEEESLEKFVEKLQKIPYLRINPDFYPDYCSGIREAEENSLLLSEFEMVCM